MGLILYICGIPKLEHDTMANFADDTTFMAVGDKPEDAATSLQTTVNLGKLYWFLRRNSSGSMYNNYYCTIRL